MCYPTHLFPLNLYIFLDFWGHGHMFLDSITPLPPIFSYRSLTPYYTLFTQIFVFLKETLEIIVFKMLKMNSQNRPKKPGAPNLLYKYYMRNYGLKCHILCLLCIQCIHFCHILYIIIHDSIYIFITFLEWHIYLFIYWVIYCFIFIFGSTGISMIFGEKRGKIWKHE